MKESHRLEIECCFMSTETVQIIRDAQEGHLYFHTAPELWV